MIDYAPDKKMWTDTISNTPWLDTTNKNLLNLKEITMRRLARLGYISCLEYFRSQTSTPQVHKLKRVLESTVLDN